MVNTFVKAVAVKTVKPIVGESAWRRLRAVVRAATRPARPPSPVKKRSARTLTELGREFKTDKVSIHHYTERYEHHLRHLRSKRFTLLEVGIGGYRRDGAGGASLRMWKAFFPKAEIVGLDIEDKSFVEEPRIRTYTGSQTDEELLARIAADADDLRVIIDDGSHRSRHIRTTFRVLFPLLADGGIYAIEDTQTSYWPEIGGSEDRHDPQTTMALVKDLVDGLNYEEYVDEEYDPSYSDLNVKAVHAYHNLVVIEKGRNAEGTRRRAILKRRYQKPVEPKIG
ncbi:MAG TPA: hypothetical protein VIM10_12725 [Actinopolymorphaceae bacterium]|jgi:demethylmacrocin O-methyltransferase